MREGWEKQAQEFVEQLEDMNSKVAIFKVKIGEYTRENQNVFEKYLTEHRKILKGQEGDLDAKGSFNDYLQAKYGNEPEYKGKIIVAEISGNIGPLSDEYGLSVVDLENADLTGSRLVDLYIESNLKDAILRDCYCKKVTFKCNLENVDFRGSKVQKCHFYGYLRQDERLNGMKFDFADTVFAREKGVLEIEDNSALYELKRGQRIAAVEREVKEALETRIKKIKKEKKTKDGLVGQQVMLLPQNLMNN